MLPNIDQAVQVFGHLHDGFPIQGNNILGMSQVIAQPFEDFYHFLGSTARSETSLLAKDLITDHYLGLIRELQAFQQAGMLIPALPLFLQLQGFIDSGRGQQLSPVLLGETLRDQPNEAQLDTGDHAEQPHAYRGILQVLAGDEAAHAAEHLDKYHR